MAALARQLAEHHRVELIGPEPVELAGYRDVLGVDLAGLPQRVVPLDPDYRSVQQASAGYDVFWNVSQGDIFPGLAAGNALVVFVPGPPPAPEPADADPPAGLVGPRAVPLSGLYPPEAGLGRFVRWSGPELRLLLTGLPTRGPAALRLVASGLRGRGVPSAEIALYDEGGLLERWRLPNRRFFGITVPLPEPRPARMVLRLTTTTFVPARFGADDRRELGVAVADLSVLTRPTRRHVDYFPRVGPALRGWTPRRRALWEQASYDLLVTTSRFGSGWAERRWGRRGELLYPPVPVERVAPAAKQDVIVGVGPSPATGLDPGHRAMVAMFRRLCDGGLTGWRLLLLRSAGGGGRHLDELRRAAEGYPVELVADADQATVQRGYACARICWHATGLGPEDRAPDDRPLDNCALDDEALGDRAQPDGFEPFAAGVVAAMAAGCVPVALRRASLPEIVDEGRTGLLWDTPAQGAELTRGLVADPERRQRLAEAPRAASRRFSEAAFRSRLAELTGRLDPLVAASRR
jgi:glycosyltransferase involved in cell wall biosynthesis